MNFQLALTEIEKMERAYRAFSEVKDILTALVSLDQANDEVKAQNLSLNKERSTLIEEVKKKRDILKQLDSSIVVKENEAANKAEATLKLSLENIRSKCLEKEEEEQKKLESLQNSLVEKQKLAVGLDSYIASKQKELEMLEQKIASTRETITNMLRT